MCLDNTAPSQYLNHPFTSVVNFNGKLVFLGETGVFEQGGQLDVATPIDAYFDTPLIDFGAREEKSLEAIDVGYETYGTMELRLIAGEESASTRIVTLPKIDRNSNQQGHSQTLRKAANSKARYHQVRVSNVDGCDFSLDYLALAPVFYKRRNQR
jgi:hypothetical protein